MHLNSCYSIVPSCTQLMLSPWCVRTVSDTRFCFLWCNSASINQRTTSRIQFILMLTTAHCNSSERVGVRPQHHLFVAFGASTLNEVWSRYLAWMTLAPLQDLCLLSRLHLQGIQFTRCRTATHQTEIQYRGGCLGVISKADCLNWKTNVGAHFEA